MLTRRQALALADAIESAVAVDGRGIRVPVVRLEVLDDELCLRIDDEENPEFWACVRLPDCAVLAMVELIVGHGVSPTADADRYATTDADTDADPFTTA